MSDRPISINTPAITVPWFTMWIFTIAFAHLSFLQGVAVLAVWPYYLGDVVAMLLRVR